MKNRPEIEHWEKGHISSQAVETDKDKRRYLKR